MGMGAKLTTLMYSVRTSTLGGLFTQKRGRVEFKNVKLGPRITYAQGTCWVQIIEWRSLFIVYNLYNLVNFLEFRAEHVH